MGKILVKRFDVPDEVVSVPGNVSNVVTLRDTCVAWSISQPGWRWSKDVKPLVGTPSCQIQHQGVVLSGQMQISSEDGIQRTIGPRAAFDIQPGHDGWIPGMSLVYSLNSMVFKSGENHNWARKQDCQSEKLYLFLRGPVKIVYDAFNLQ